MHALKTRSLLHLMTFTKTKCVRNTVCKCRLERIDILSTFYRISIKKKQPQKTNTAFSYIIKTKFIITLFTKCCPTFSTYVFKQQSMKISINKHQEDLLVVFSNQWLRNFLKRLNFINTYLRSRRHFSTLLQILEVF